MGDIQERYLQMKQDFEILGSWSMRYQSLIEMGRDREPLDSRYKTEEYYVDGCVSALWIRGELRTGRLYFQIDSDGILPKGLAALLADLFSGALPEEILTWDGNPSQDLGFYQNLTPTRVQAFSKMITRFKECAVKAQEGHLHG